MLNDLERSSIACYREASTPQAPVKATREETAIFLGLQVMLEAGRLIRERRGEMIASDVIVKDDGSPATEVEQTIEATLRQWLVSLGSEAVVVGEETGGSVPSRGLAVAIDPIDGTRAFLAETETFTTTLAVIKDGVPFLGMVSNPTTGEIAYGVAGGESRLVRLSLFGEDDEGQSLTRASAQLEPVLVNIHPSRLGGTVVQYLYQAWENGEISQVRSPGGSPAWALVEAARGYFTYGNLWSKRPAEAFDLAAGTLIVRGAGGEVIDLEGQPIDEMRHTGPFVAGIDSAGRSKVRALLRQAREAE